MMIWTIQSNCTNAAKDGLVACGVSTTLDKAKEAALSNYRDWHGAAELLWQGDSTRAWASNSTYHFHVYTVDLG